MMLWFHGMAASRLLLRRKAPIARMITIVFAGSLWCVVGVCWMLGMMRETDAIAHDVQLRLSIRQEVGTDTVQILRRAIAHMPAVQAVTFKSGGQAAKEFFHSIDVNDASLEEIISVPDVVIVTPIREYCTTSRMELLERTLRSTYPEIERVVWPRNLVMSIERRSTDLLILGLVAGLMSLILFALALTYAFRAEIHAADSDLSVGWIMGARSWFIAAPHIIVGVTSVVVGGGLAALLSAAVWPTALESLPWLVRVRPDEIGSALALCAGVGCLLSVWQSVVAARRASKHL